MIVTGFDIGGAHLKVARAEQGRIVAARTLATPVWRGLDHLHAALDEAMPLCSAADRIAVTMTAELSDIFASRAAGVATLLDIVAQRLSAERVLVYGGRAGFLPPEAASAHTGDIASANWHASAALVAARRPDALFADMGSTTTDLVPVSGGTVAARGYTDAERLVTGELVYTGFVRSFVFALASKAPVAGRFVPLMNEYFASAADVHRILCVLDEADDLHPSADGQAKTIEASIARLARLVGLDAGDLDRADWTRLAAWFSEAQLRLVHDAALTAGHALPDDAPLVTAGIGRWQLSRLADRLGRPCVDFAALINADPSAADAASGAAPASAVALLVAGLWSKV